MNLLTYGDRALLLEVADTDEVIGWTTAIRDAALPGVVDLVPGARTVLMIGDEPQVIPRLQKDLKGLSPTETTTLDDGPVVEVPVVYDGPDLDDIARLTGLDTNEVIEAHAGTTWKVAFGGFAPGFAYLIGGDTRLEVPRRDTSRTRVPAGAVGLAGEFSGIYPRSSPGGWQLLGHTDLPMWDVDRDPPALLQPGTRVQFRRAES
ncbi:5-oxoprolinase subunit B family protein [Williamsia soli]|uniref:5-oxoprolinase subunit B family protein n=1 Tax=Williamsia soli TaxID=364929 RepID=UPI001A9D28CD|nr:allophanate hydrolase subunit 1 [Williamsia soli]